MCISCGTHNVFQDSYVINTCKKPWIWGKGDTRLALKLYRIDLGFFRYM